MTGPRGSHHGAVVDDADLRLGLERALCDDRGTRVEITHLARRSSPYQTSAALEELDVGLADGAHLRLIFKQTGHDSMQDAARRVKPAFLHDPRREIETYRRVLSRAGLGTARCYGVVTDERRGQYWLFLERVDGVELYQCGSLATWRQVAEWLADMHHVLARHGAPMRARRVHALRYDAAYYRMWLDRALRLARLDPSRQRVVGGLEWLAGRYDSIVDRLVSLPATFIHGEFYASNVIVCEQPATWRVCPVDWETAAVGPGLMDLAALTAGWPERERREIALAYHAALPPLDRQALQQDAFLHALDCCLIQVAIQWLGWFGSRQAPTEHARDWLTDAIHLAEGAVV